MMARLLAEMKAETRTSREEMRTNQDKMEANQGKVEAKIDGCLEKTGAWLEEMKPSLGKTGVRMDSGRERIETEIKPDVE
jgi:chromosome condensin MukBEF ATPase and DNA-binding subunit MukB